MRDPLRIPRILGKLETIWQDNPDLRFFQALDAVTRKIPNTLGGDKFYVEDDVTEKAFDEWIKEYELSKTGGWKS